MTAVLCLAEMRWQTICSSVQRSLGCTIFDVQNGKMTLDFDKNVIRKLWDNYYVPFIKGYFEANGHFRSDDIKTGTILSYVGSSSSATFFPDSVMTSDDDSHSIELKVLRIRILRVVNRFRCSRVRAWL